MQQSTSNATQLEIPRFVSYDGFFQWLGSRAPSQASQTSTDGSDQDFTPEPSPSPFPDPESFSNGTHPWPLQPPVDHDMNDAFTEPRLLVTENTNPIPTLHVGDYSRDQSRLTSDPRLVTPDASTPAPIAPSTVGHEPTPAPHAVQPATTNSQPVISMQDAAVPTRFLDFMVRNIVAANEDLSVARHGIRAIIQRHDHDHTEHVRDIPAPRGRTKGNSWDNLPDDVKKKLQREIRDHARVLMKRVSDADKFDISTMPTETDVTNFNPRLGPSCNIQNFKVDLRKEPHSEFNRSAAVVFATSFNSYYGYQHKMRLIEDMFAAHLKELQYLFRLQASGPARIQTHRSKRRSDARKLKLLRERQKYATGADSEMLARLGRDGMSSDESDTDETNTKFNRVLIKPWRSSAVTLWVRRFDAPSDVQPIGSTKGPTARLRLRSTKVGTRTDPVKSLPRNAYNSDWLLQLDEYTKGCLEIENRDFGFR